MWSLFALAFAFAFGTQAFCNPQGLGRLLDKLLEFCRIGQLLPILPRILQPFYVHALVFDLSSDDRLVFDRQNHGVLVEQDPAANIKKKPNN